VTDDLRQRYADTLREALRADCEDTEDPLVDCLGCTVDAVLAVRDEEMTALRERIAELEATPVDWNAQRRRADELEARAEQAEQRAAGYDAECAAVRRQLTAARMDASGLRREAAALAAQRDHALAGRQIQYDLTVAHASMREQAEAANARVRELHARDDTSPHGPWCGTCMTAWPCATWAALDGEENQP
jgi:chromosome segregation ATPase